MSGWTLADLPSQAGRTANRHRDRGPRPRGRPGARRRRAEVIVAGRNPDKGAAALARIRQAVPEARVAFEPLDSRARSVAAFAERMAGSRDRIDLLINNAAVMAPPTRQVSRRQRAAIRHQPSRHFALAARLLPLLRRAGAPRIVSLSSVAARRRLIAFEDLQAERAYRPVGGLQPVEARPADVRPRTPAPQRCRGMGPCQPRRPSGHRPHRSAAERRRRPQRRRAGAEPPVVPCSSPSRRARCRPLRRGRAGGGKRAAINGPIRLGETRGAPGPARIPAQALGRGRRPARLWEMSERLAGVSFPEVR